MEHGPRLAEFRSAKNKGYSDGNALFEAADVIDYADAGTAIRKLNPYVPFLNPAIRGNTRFLQSLKDPKTWGKGAAYITVPTVANYAMRFAPTTNDTQREKLRNLKDYEKNLFWHFPVPNTDRLVAVPKGIFVAQVFANPVERALDYIYDETLKTAPELAKDTMKDMLNVLIPPMGVVGLTSLLEWQANHDFFTGMPIEDREMQAKMDKTERYNSFTSELAKNIGKGTGQSPAKIDHLIKGLTGGVGRDVLDITDNFLSSDGSRPSKTRTLTDILNPLRAFEHNETSSSGIYDFLYDQQLKDKEAGFKGTDAQTAYKEMQEINKEIKEIRESTSLSAKEKKEKIARLRDSQRKIGSDYLKNK